MELGDGHKRYFFSDNLSLSPEYRGRRFRRAILLQVGLHCDGTQ
jgi:hypothetical protein